jgi:hypothetical protein
MTIASRLPLPGTTCMMTAAASSNGRDQEEVMAVTGETLRAGHPQAIVETGTGAEPVLIDLGRKRRKLVKQLRRGRGPLLEDVTRVIQELKDNGSIAGSAQPVIVIVRERMKPPALLPRW